MTFSRKTIFSKAYIRQITRPQMGKKELSHIASTFYLHDYGLLKNSSETPWGASQARVSQ
jgi:hypothetical protein